MSNIREIARQWAQNILPDPSTVDRGYATGARDRAEEIRDGE